jgi:hypothetical protein
MRDIGHGEQLEAASGAPPAASDEAAYEAESANRTATRSYARSNPSFS